MAVTIKYMECLLFLQPSQPLLRILDLRNLRINVFPQVEEFLVMLYSVGLPSLSAFLLTSITQLQSHLI